MTAANTALRVLNWANVPDGRPPVGPLWDATALAHPSPVILNAATNLARRSVAMLGAGSPPLGAEKRLGLGVIFLAAAVGGRSQLGPAITLAQAVPAMARRRDVIAWYDLIARHGLVSAAVTALTGTETAIPAGAVQTAPGESAMPSAADEQEPLPEVLLAASPLSAVLYRPPLRALRTETTQQAVRTAVALLERPRGPQVLAAGLANWMPFPTVLTWRAELLTRLRPEHLGLLLDVYLTARLRFGAEWDNRVRWAGRQLRSRGAADPLALATLRFWAPLEVLDRDSSLSALRPLMTGHDTAIDLVRLNRLDRAGAA